MRKRLTDKEILARLKECDDLLETYVKMVRPVAAELARRKSEYVFGRKGRCAYRGELGCWEEGIDTICLHLKDRENRKSMTLLEKKIGDRPYSFRARWAKKLDKAGIKRVTIGGHY